MKDRAPLSEIYGRQIIFAISFGAYTAFNGATVASQNSQTVLVLRFLAGSFGSSPMANAGGVIADIFQAKERGLAMCLFSVAPFMGPGGSCPHWESPNPIIDGLQFSARSPVDSSERLRRGSGSRP